MVKSFHNADNHDVHTDHKQLEETFHDNWATAVDLQSIDVPRLSEACTAPEIRWITKRLGSLGNKSVLDLGCGFGEAAVYFALKGARVSVVDLSPNMLEAAQAIARRYDVEIQTYRSDVEALSLMDGLNFDVVYVGNLFHHVDLERTLKAILRHLKLTGVLVSWDPLAYNPIINVYRKIARKVRTPGEHPLGRKDLNVFHTYFDSVELEFFWLTTLIIFLIMAFVQWRNPNRVRYWKKIVEEGDRWCWLYKPLERLDRVLLRLFPFLKPLCWNVCVIATRPRFEHSDRMEEA